MWHWPSFSEASLSWAGSFTWSSLLRAVLRGAEHAVCKLRVIFSRRGADRGAAAVQRAVRALNADRQASDAALELIKANHAAFGPALALTSTPSETATLFGVETFGNRWCPTACAGADVSGSNSCSTELLPQLCE